MEQETFAGVLAQPAPVEQPKPKRRKEDAPTDPRHHPMKLKLVAAFLEIVGSVYGFLPRDAKAITTVLAYPDATDAEALRRWRIGLSNPPGYYRIATIHELAEKWNGLAQPTLRIGTGPPSRRADIEQADHTSEAL